MAEIRIKWDSNGRNPYTDSVWEGVPDTCAESVTDLLNSLEDAVEAKLPPETLEPFLKGVERLATDIYIAVRKAGKGTQ